MALRKAYYYLLSVGAEYYMQLTPADKILFITDSLNILRTTVVSLMDEVLSK
jgi:hypothetical protein